MKKYFIPFILLAFSLSSPVVFAEEPSKEYALKAAYLHKFFFFADWPEKAFYEAESTIVIGILGEDSFGGIFTQIEGKSINGRRLTIRRFGETSLPEMLRRCQILFVSRSLDKDEKSILASLKDYPVLTVGETETFLESGGMIGFITKKNSIRFEISQAAAERAGIKIRAQLLRVAVRVIEE